MSDDTQTHQTDSNDTPAAPVWPRVLTLKYPVQFGSESITSLTFRRGRAGDLKGLKLGETVPADQLITIASRMSGKPTQVIEGLDGDDASEVMALVLDFYGRCLGGGSARAQ